MFPNYKKYDITNWDTPIEKSNKAVICLHPSHNPPMHLCIPVGSEYIHKCPSCGYTIRLVGTNIVF